ncbi:hypothetical protein SJI00_17015 [Pseudomonas sp. RP23018S]|uniref:hypothetical protein n=1 Tax=Pseudomonas sp. RP23018S TaxID=3096037 RepID=UPI002ACA4089|nr:hypothetical protein [Pseudomonas sp. RP23018S]MDZ5604474.1 hypothetical protein [Pseudomonas sp. RP23018S]
MDIPDAGMLGNSIVSFFPDVPQAQREAVTLAMLMAEHETNLAFKQGHISAWLAYYRNKLKFYGWDGAPPEQAHWPDPERGERVDQALALIGKTAGTQHVETMRAAYAGLRDAPPQLLQFETAARERRSFSLLPCGPAQGARVDIVVYREAMVAEEITAGFLFHERRQSKVEAELVRFNTRLFEQTFRAKVVSALGTLQLRELRKIHLKPSARG